MSVVNVRASRGGFVLEYGDMQIGFDTSVPNGPTLLSHSHADHTRSIQHASEIIATKGTIDTFTARGGRVHSKVTIVETGSSIFYGDLIITVLNAGHVLGSSMFLIELADNQRVLYTGDFNTEDSLVHSRAHPVDADVLIMDSTYGEPRWVFPSRERVYGDIVTTAKQTLDEGKTPRFHAYSLGKAQEAIALLQREGFDVVTGNKSIDRVSQVYNRHGSGLEFTPLDSQEAKHLFEAGCVVVSSSNRHMFYNLAKLMGSHLAKQIEATTEDFNLSGWTLSQYGKGGLPLSAHTDYPGLIKFAKAVSPVITYCFTENGRVMADGLSKEGLAAIPLE
ncbi:MAG: MBL fold metallo-hydrolase [Candidatus Thorarchaeota archaeon]|nr:MBL fold metallo-hydrolase [Candidatus Thorarchaeota archaeon]